MADAEVKALLDKAEAVIIANVSLAEIYYPMNKAYMDRNENLTRCTSALNLQAL